MAGIQLWRSIPEVHL